MLYLTFSACNDETTNFQYKQIETENLEVKLMISKSGGEYNTGPSYPGEHYVEYRGDGNSNLLSELYITKSHTEIYKSGTNEFRITSGEFQLAASDGVESLFGTYAGTGTNKSGTIEMVEDWKITGGTGKYANASGTLYVQTNNYRTNNVNYTNTLVAKIYGYLILDEH